MGSPPFVLKIEDETFGQPFRRGQETRAEQTVNSFGGEPKNANVATANVATGNVAVDRAERESADLADRAISPARHKAFFRCDRDNLTNC